MSRKYPRAPFILLLLAAALLQGVAPAHADRRPPTGFPRSTFVSGDAVTGERKQKGILLHAQWVDDEGNPRKYFKGTKRFPWPKPLAVAPGTVTLRLIGVRYPGTLEVGIFRRTGPAAAPVGRHELYECTFPGAVDARCRWVPNVVGDDVVWDVRIDHPQRKGHLYVVAVGTWDDPRDPPPPVGNRSQIGTWIYHGRIAGA